MKRVETRYGEVEGYVACNLSAKIPLELSLTVNLSYWIFGFSIRPSRGAALYIGPLDFGIRWYDRDSD